MESDLYGKIGIYCFENLTNNKKYIGQSVNVGERIMAHVYMLRGGYDESIVLQNAWNKYGEKNFDFRIIEECSYEELNEKEKYWINELRSHIFFDGYNISLGGSDGLRGRKHTDESKMKMSDASRGRVFSEDTRKRMSESHKGKIVSEETKIKISESIRGKNNPNYGVSCKEETKKKISASNLGKKRINATSIYSGVSFNKSHNKWKSELRYNKKIYFVGYFLDEINAALAYNKKAMELCGKDAKLNIIDKEEYE